LLLLVGGVPLALILAGAWSLLVGTSDLGGAPRVTGAQALLLDVPGHVLFVGTAVASLVYAARALRQGAHGGGWGLWASAVGVLVTVLMTATACADTLMAPHSEVLLWVVRVGSVAVALVAALVARAWAVRPPD
jgi:hypothetical protein